MNKILQIIVFCTIHFLAGNIYSQTNLICNHSFEFYDVAIRDRLNNSTELYTTHFSQSPESEEDLFDCWYSKFYPGVIGQGQTIQGISWGIVPGLFPIYTGNENLSFNAYNGLLLGDNDLTPKAFRPEQGSSGLSLEAHPNSGLFGFDLTPPNTIFGDNVDAPDGSNYVALFDFENQNWRTKPAIATKLKYPIVKDIVYTFSMYYAEMNKLGIIKDADGWGNVKNGKLKVWVCDEDFQHKQEIFCVDIDDDNWNVTAFNFTADRSSTHLYIEYDPVTAQVLTLGEKLGGVFIDNLKLYEACETNENMCNNANYRRDMLDADLELVNLESPLAFPDPEDNSNDPGILKSIRAVGLENVKHFEMYIKNPAGNTIRNIVMDYPPSTVVWDGRNNDGIMQPDDNNYEATLFYVKNDCFEIGGYSTGGASYVDIKNFDLKSKYSVFNINITNTMSGHTLITGLDNVHYIDVKLYTINGDFVNHFEIQNPRSSIGISNQSFYAATGTELSTASYVLRVYVLNNCNHSSMFEKTYCLLGDQLEDQGTAYDELFDYASIAKNTIFQCPFEAFYNHNLLAPMNCCEGNLYLNNVDIWTSWLVNIKGDIYIGSNTTFEEGSVNVLHAGEQIILDPTDHTITINNQTTILKPNTFECEICKMYEITANEDQDNENNRELVNLNDTATSLIQDFVVYPNPFSSGEITINSNISSINIKNLKLELTNSVGVPIPIIITSKNTRMIKFKLTQKPASGIYYIYYVSDGIEKTFPLVIQD